VYLTVCVIEFQTIIASYIRWRNQLNNKTYLVEIAVQVAMKLVEECGVQVVTTESVDFDPIGVDEETVYCLARQDLIIPTAILVKIEECFSLQMTALAASSDLFEVSI